MTMNINSPFRKNIFAEDVLRGRTVRGIAESPESRAYHGAVVRWRASRDLNILSPEKRKGRVVSKWSVPVNYSAINDRASCFNAIPYRKD